MVYVYIMLSGNYGNLAGDLDVKSPRPVGVPSLRLENPLSPKAGFRSHGVPTRVFGLGGSKLCVIFLPFLYTSR